ncbi:M12 family metallo-peptidase [Saprospiraceae bacterium]|nr:M12 family metallo-peptidase [Saprospiraceae bacterium]
MKTIKLFALLMFFCIGQINAQSTQNNIAQQVEQQFKISNQVYQSDLFSVENEIPLKSEILQNELVKASFLKITEQELESLDNERPDLLTLSLPYSDLETMQVRLFKKEFLKNDFQVFTGSNSSTAFDYKKGLYYWGMVEGDNQSVVAISISSLGLSGFIYSDNETYNLGPINGGSKDEYILYKESDLKISSTIGCEVDETTMTFKDKIEEEAEMMDANNCVNMYVEADHNIFLGKGGTQQAADYVNDVFSQVAILYANETINFGVSELKVWDVPSPYTGPGSGDYLNQFRNHLNGNYNGDLAHLVGYGGSGGIAYVNVVCNSVYGVGYSSINSTFNIVPTYSWTIMVVTHEIGHNLGSSHTHSCVWNGDNSAIDRCGPAAGYDQEPCNDSAPIPTAGTIMSYCHLLGGVGIDLNLGFGPQPGDLIRSKVYNGSCLSSCSAPTADDAGITAIVDPSGPICASSIVPSVDLQNFGTNTLSSVTINYSVDGGSNNVFNWTGSLASGSTVQVSLNSISYALGSHSFDCNTSNPNGSTDEDPLNDSSSSSFTSQASQTYYQDLDGDGYGNPSVSVLDCTQPNGYVSDNTDCNDGNSNIYPGGSCTDGDICTSGDSYDSNCNCVGTYADSDGDGVCDGEDICEGGDDNADADGDGIPDFCDCNVTQTNFPDNPLTHSGGGSSSSNLSFANGDKDASFTVSNMGAKLNGNPNNRYEDVVNISYVNGNGSTINYGTFYGSNQSSVTVNISGEHNSITVNLSNGQNNNSVSVNIGVVNYCSGTPPCPDMDNDGVCDADDQCQGLDDNLIGTSCNDGDICTSNDVWGVDCNCNGVYADSDGDGVCDGEDICPGGDDNADADGDGIPDACDGNCTDITSQFPTNPLTHQGSGSSSTALSFPTGNQDVSFTISDLNAKINGNPNSRYIDEVTVSYVDNIGSTITYGVFSGDIQSSVSVSISGVVQSVNVSLADGYDGNAGNRVLSVDISSVNSCIVSGNLEGEPSIPILALVYPNPANESIWINLSNQEDLATIRLFDILGTNLGTFTMEGQKNLQIPLYNLALSNQQLIFVTIEVPGEDLLMRKIVISK